MNTDQRLAHHEKQIKALEREKAAALKALELAASLGSFESSFSQQSDCLPILQEICRRTRVMVRFQDAAVHLIDQETLDLGLAHHDAPDLAAFVDRELNDLILDHSFAFAVQSARPCFFLTSDRRHLLLHVIATPGKVRGMFVGLLDQDRNDILDTTLSLFTVVMLAGAHALESFELNLRFHQHRRELERKVEERTASLRETNQQLNTVLDNILAGVLLVDATDHVIVNINPAGLRMIGGNREDVIGRKCFQFLCSTQEGHCPITDLNQTMDNAERDLLTMSGEKIPVLKTVARTLLNGRPHLIETFVDITEQKKLAQLKDDIERITRHDLKTPLNGIIGIPDILLGRLALNEEERDLLKGVKESGLKMLRMINMSLDLYKLEMGTYEYQPGPLNLAAILRSVLRDLDSYVVGKRLALRATVDGAPSSLGSPLLVQGEELLFYSMLSNLLKNATEASPFGAELSIAIDTRPTPRIAIHNRGLLPAGMREHFFEKYATSGKRDGTGLGTYSAMLIARAMGGNIEVDVHEPDGVTVTVALPNEEAKKNES